MAIVCLGDSLTYGHGLKGEEVWTYLLEKKYDVKMINKGINGDSTYGMLARFFRDVVDNEPTHVIIMGGSNDLAQGVSTKAVQSNIATMVYQALHNNIMPIIGIQPVGQVEMAMKCFPVINNYQEVSIGLADLRQWIISFAKMNNLPTIDFFEEIASRITQENINELYLDGIHFTAKGNELLADMVPLQRFMKIRCTTNHGTR